MEKHTEIKIDTTRTPRQAFKDALDSGAVQAWADRKPIELASNRDRKWEPFVDEHPKFSTPHHIWRPAPEKRKVRKPHTIETFPVPAGPRSPLVRLRRLSDIETELRVIGFDSHTSINAGCAGYFGFDEMLVKEMQLSTDGGVTWVPAWQEVEE